MIYTVEHVFGADGVSLGYVIPGPWELNLPTSRGALHMEVRSGDVAVLMQIGRIRATWLTGSIREVYEAIREGMKSEEWARQAAVFWNRIAERKSEYWNELDRREREAEAQKQREAASAEALERKVTAEDFARRKQQLQKKWRQGEPERSPAEVEAAYRRAVKAGQPALVRGEVPSGATPGSAIVGPMKVSQRISRPTWGAEGDFRVERTASGFAFYVPKKMIAVLGRVEKYYDLPGNWRIGSEQAVWRYLNPKVASLIRHHHHAPGLYTPLLHQEFFGLSA